MDWGKDVGVDGGGLKWRRGCLSGKELGGMKAMLGRTEGGVGMDRGRCWDGWRVCGAE